MEKRRTSLAHKLSLETQVGGSSHGAVACAGFFQGEGGALEPRKEEDQPCPQAQPGNTGSSPLTDGGVRRIFSGGGGGALEPTKEEDQAGPQAQPGITGNRVPVVLVAMGLWVSDGVCRIYKF